MGINTHTARHTRGVSSTAAETETGFKGNSNIGGRADDEKRSDERSKKIFLTVHHDAPIRN